MPDDSKSPSHSPPSKSPPSNPKLSPILPLAPLEYLQNQRRGSITDPSLHAAPLSQKPTPQPHPFRPHADPSTSLNSSPSAFIKDNYTFGDATPRTPASESTQLRRLLHSPSHEQEGSPPNGKAARGELELKERSRLMYVNGTSESPRRASIDPLSMRRPSTTGPELAQSYLGKRKMSLDRGLPGVEDMEGPLAGPGVSGMDVDGPAPKRRSSAVDARIAKLSLNDRRNSVDSRGTTTGGWWTTGGTTSTPSGTSERRDSTSSLSTCSLFSNLSALSAIPGGEGRGPPSVAAFAWTTNGHSSAESIPMHQETVDPYSRSQFDPNQPQLPIIPPLSFPPDRRMSAPDTAAPPTGPTRVLRSRSRPPSRQMRASEPSNSQASPSSAQEDQSPPAPSSTSKASKEPGSTPYSRSPELRVSHKLAERKRRKEMKDLFDELRDQLPADRGMKASKWEILSKAIDFVQQLKQSHQDMAREIDMLRGELDVLRQNPALAQFPPGAPVVYPHPVPGPYPIHPHPPPNVPHPPHGVLPHPHAPHPQHHPQPPGPPQPSLSRPSSSQNIYSPTPGPNAHPQPPPPQQNGTMTRAEVPPT
ncbi:hypothetical protein E1B28_004354 [Marasmius oreades]|uniref:BHLH domain-containing protein n=1 Tax=Marasmius oreades TaxID=181124 RepID=A0A9P8ACV8_9AGAR|nr:uncharacterized protein E1B28_004354 [Marasmius oreades]KAG7096957.1 hypothetical protein E1B28_004354 [Marasmius oreades]